ncbi:MAG: hypothetical protein MRY83_16675 [Flavobacteriales bacterium]|nr:hypothetical protein [Flavobacteriales bacterium]
MKSTSNFLFLFITIGLVIAAVMLGFGFGFDSFFELVAEWKLNISSGILTLYFSGLILSKPIYKLIHSKSYNSIVVGMVGLLMILVFGIIGGSLIGFFQEGLTSELRSFNNATIDYIIKPLYWILIFGSLPTLILGGVLGAVIKKYAAK